MRIGIARILAALRANPRSAGGQQAEDNAMLQDLLTERKVNGASSGQKTTRHGGGASPRKQVAWLVKNPPEGSVTVNVTPEIADVMLAYNDRNRPVSPNTVREYARQITEGKWVHTREPIIFSETERLIDGQHRLLACVESGRSFTVDVAFGAPDEAFGFIDIGKKRTAADIFAINGVAQYTVVAAAMPWVLQYDEDGDIGRNTSAHKRTPDELYQGYLRHTDIERSVAFGRTLCDAGFGGAGMMTAMHYICARRSRADADEFFQTLAEGFGFTSKTDARFKLHKTLQDNRAAPKDDRLSSRRIAAYTIKAWNAWRRGDQVRQFKMADGERFPRAR